MRTLPVLAFLFAGCEPAAEPTWAIEVDDDRGALLSVGGTASFDTWLVGGGLGDGGARVLHWDGEQIVEAEVDLPETLWWVWTDPDGESWMVGEGGMVVRDLERLEAPTDETLYGVWGPRGDDVWLVGAAGTILRWDGREFARVELPAPAGDLFKVWGATADDVWIVGAQGAIWRWHEGVFTDHRRDTQAGILTVHGCAVDEVYAVGGARIWRWDGAAWRDEPAPAFAMAVGVACGPDEVLAVGAQGARARRDRATGTWTDDTFEPYVATHFHGAWIAPDGALWAVGGDYLRPAGGGARRGVVMRRR